MQFVHSHMPYHKKKQFLLKRKFERATRGRKSKDRQYNDEIKKDKGAQYNLKSTTQKLKIA